MSQLLDSLLPLLEEGNTQELLQQTASLSQEDAQEAAVQALHAYAQCIETLRIYLERANALYAQTRKKGAAALLNRMFLGKDEFYSDSIHANYYQDIQANIEQLADALSHLSQENSLRSRLSFQVAQALTRAVPEEQKEMRFLLSADDGFVQQLLPFLDQASLNTLLGSYLTQYPKKRDRMPNQEQLLQALQQLIR